MTKLQKLQLKQSELRQSLAAMLDTAEGERGDDHADDLAKVTAEMRALEPELSAAIALGDEPAETVKTDSPEDREHRHLLDRSDLSSIFAATLEHRSTDGATRELQEELGLDANQIPLAMLMETRATGVTAAPGDVGANQAEIIPAVFPMAAAAYLGVATPTVGVGEAVYPVLSTSADAGTPAEGATQDETAGAFTADLLAPSRIQASFRYSREDRARFRGMSEALRSNLNDALADKLDQQIIAGTNGLLHSTNLANHNVTTETTYALYRSQFAFGRVDGKYASTTGELRVVLGADTFAHAASQYRGNNDNMDALMSLREATGGVKVSAHVPVAASNKQNAIVRLGLRPDMVAPIWEGVTLIPDEITKAAGGEIVITAVMLHAVKILRAAGFHKQQTQHA